MRHRLPGNRTDGANPYEILLAFFLISGPAAAQAHSLEVHQSIVDSVQIYSVNDVEIVSQTTPSEEGRSASFNAYLIVTAEGNLCTASSVASRVVSAGKKIDGFSITHTKDLTLQAVKIVDFDKPLTGCTAQGEQKKMRIALAERDVLSPYRRSVVYRIPYVDRFGAGEGIAILTITFDKRGWHVTKEGFTPSFLDKKWEGPVIGPNDPIDFDDREKSMPPINDRT